MSTVSARDACIEVASIRVFGAHLRGWVLTQLLVAAALAAGGAVYLGLQTPGEVIRREDATLASTRVASPAASRVASSSRSIGAPMTKRVATIRQ
jgi:hypothetical protein